MTISLKNTDSIKTGTKRSILFEEVQWNLREVTEYCTPRYFYRPWSAVLYWCSHSSPKISKPSVHWLITETQDRKDLHYVWRQRGINILRIQKVTLHHKRRVKTKQNSSWTVTFLSAFEKSHVQPHRICSSQRKKNLHQGKSSWITVLCSND